MALWSRLWRLVRRRQQQASEQPSRDLLGKPGRSAPVVSPRRPPARPTNVRVAALAADLAHRDTHRRHRAAVALGQIGRPAVESLPALVRALVDLQPTVRRAAAEALARIDRDWP